MDRYELVLNDVTEIDRRGLQRAIPPEDLVFMSPEVPEGTHGELVMLTAFVVVSLASITGVTAFMLKGRTREVQETSHTVRKPDGTEVTVVTKIDRSSSTPPEKQVLEGLASALGVSVDVLTKV